VSDERRGLPSASSAHRYALCPGSFLLEQSIQEPETSGADAQIGNRIHSRLAGETVELNEEETKIAGDCIMQETLLFPDVFPDSHNLHFVRERRLWGYDNWFAKKWSGKPDVVIHDGKKALVIDYKTGRGDVTHATGNLQLRALAVLANEHFGPFEEITVAIIQPLAGEPTTCTYTVAEIEKATSETHGLMERVRVPNQPRNPSTEACKYCKAKEVCPEAQGVVANLPALVPRDGLEIVMTPEQIAEFLVVAPLAEAVIESVRGKARRMIEAGQTVPGWKLKPGATREAITNPELAFARFMDAGGTQAQFVQAITVAKTKFKDAVKAATGKKGRDLDGFVEIMLEGCTETKSTAPSLVQDKEVAK
jgi:CRISPR/Cas system-associated exonuclease Cas4 (RecB family)